MSILVIGSLIIDNTLYVSDLPSRGETAIATSALTSFGGKGANQALAASAAGGEVHLLCCVGNDSAGQDYREYLSGNGFDPSLIITDDQFQTGSAFLGVEQSGENSIIVNPGSNHALRPEHLDENIQLFEQSDMLLLQLELPLDTIRHACQMAREHDVSILINPSPWSESFNTVDFPCDILVMNEHEAACFTGEKPFRITRELLHDHHLETVIVTQGVGPTLQDLEFRAFDIELEEGRRGNSVARCHFVQRNSGNLEGALHGEQVRVGKTLAHAGIVFEQRSANGCSRNEQRAVLGASSQRVGEVREGAPRPRIHPLQALELLVIGLEPPGFHRPRHGMKVRLDSTSGAHVHGGDGHLLEERPKKRRTKEIEHAVV